MKCAVRALVAQYQRIASDGTNHQRTGAVDAGFVYGSDAQSSANARIAFVIPESFHEPIRYYSSVLSSTEHASESETFEKYLRSESARAIFQGLGFTPIQ